MTHYETICQFSKQLQNLSKWLDKAEAHAAAKKFDVDVLAAARLAPDAFSLAQQVQAACDQAKFAAAYLTGAKAPAHPDTEKTIAELRQRIRTCTDYLASVQAKDFAGSEERKVAPAWAKGKWFFGKDLRQRTGDPELQLPRHHGLRHPAPQRCGSRQDGFHRRPADAGRLNATSPQASIPSPPRGRGQGEGAAVQCNAGFMRADCVGAPHPYPLPTGGRGRRVS